MSTVIMTRLAIVALILGVIMGCSSAWKEATKDNTISSYEKFLTDHSDSKNSERARDSLASLLCYASDSTVDTASYVDFIRKYPKHKDIDEVKDKLDGLRRNDVFQAGNIEAFEKFLQEYPNSGYFDEVSEKLQALHYEEIYHRGTIQSVETFLRRYPYSEFSTRARMLAAYLIVDYITDKGTAAALDSFVSEYPQSVLIEDVERITDSLVSLVDYDQAKEHNSLRSYSEFIRKHLSSHLVDSAVVLIQNILLREYPENEYQSGRCGTHSVLAGGLPYAISKGESFVAAFLSKKVRKSEHKGMPRWDAKVHLVELTGLSLTVGNEYTVEYHCANGDVYEGSYDRVLGLELEPYGKVVFDWWHGGGFLEGGYAYVHIYSNVWCTVVIDFK